MKRDRRELVESVMTGLDQAIEYEKGNLKNVRTRKVSIEPLPHFKGVVIKRIRNKANLSQVAFAKALGVSTKTVEAWESGFNEPAGPAQRILSLINKETDFLDHYNIITAK